MPRAIVTVPAGYPLEVHRPPLHLADKYLLPMTGLEPYRSAQSQRLSG